MDVVAPHCKHALEVADSVLAVATPVWAVAQHYLGGEAGRILLGLMMCFYGGSFVKVIAVVEACQVTGVAATLERSIAVLRGHVAPCGSGLARFAAAVKDPYDLADTLSALWSAAATAVAALRVHFARTLVLGVAVAKVAQPVARRQLAPVVASALPPDCIQWAPPIVDHAVKLVAASFAWRLSRFVTAGHSACRGGSLAAEAACRLAKDHGYVRLSSPCAPSLCCAAAGSTLARLRPRTVPRHRRDGQPRLWLVCRRTPRLRSRIPRDPRADSPPLRAPATPPRRFVPGHPHRDSHRCAPVLTTPRDFSPHHRRRLARGATNRWRSLKCTSGT